MTRFISYLFALLAFALLSACGGGGGSAGATSNTVSFFTTAPSAGVTVPLGASQQYSIGGGEGPYTATSSNSAVAVAQVQGTTLTVGGVASGSTSITLRDSRGSTLSLPVTVALAQALATNAPSSLTLTVGAANAQTYNVRGGVPPYSVVSSNTGVLSASLAGSSLTLTGLSAGTATAQITDAAGSTVTLAVTVSATSGQALFTTAPSPVTIATGTSASYSIGGGTAPYSATTSNASVATATVSGNNLTITGLTSGAATIAVRDAAGTAVNVAVTISNAAMSLSPASVTALVGDTLYVSITGGVGPYSAVVTNAAVADATIGTLSGGVFTVNSSGKVLRVVPKQQASGVPIIVSDATGSSATFSLTAAPGQPAIQVSPSTLTISERNAAAIALTVYGASGTITAFSSDPTLLQVAVSGSTITVSPGTSGSSCIAPAAAGGTQSVTISAVDSTGAKATSVITIQDNPTAACP